MMKVTISEFEYPNVKGYANFGEFYFNAKVFNEKSEFGINEGKVSKLYIFHEPHKYRFEKEVVSYDRGWIIKPEREDIAIYSAYVQILDFLDQLTIS